MLFLTIGTSRLLFWGLLLVSQYASGRWEEAVVHLCKSSAQSEVYHLFARRYCHLRLKSLPTRSYTRGLRLEAGNARHHVEPNSFWGSILKFCAHTISMRNTSLQLRSHARIQVSWLETHSTAASLKKDLWTVKHGRNQTEAIKHFTGVIFASRLPVCDRWCDLALINSNKDEIIMADSDDNARRWKEIHT